MDHDEMQLRLETLRIAVQISAPEEALHIAKEIWAWVRYEADVSSDKAAE